MPEQTVGQEAAEWSKESVEKQAAEIEQAQVEKPEVEKPEVVVDGHSDESSDEIGGVKDKVEKVVPIGAVTELRAQKREAVQRALAAEQRAEQIQRQMLEFMARQQQPAAPQIDSNDPLAVIQHQVTQTAEQQKAMLEQQQRQQYEQQQQQNYQNFVNAVKAQEAEFVKVQPDANEAIGFLKQSRVNEYKAGGLSHQEAVQRMLKDEHDLVVWAMQSGENPAKAAFDMAAARGYVSPKQKIAMQRDGQGASLPTGTGGKGGGEPSLEALLKMSGSDFAKATAGDKWEKLLKKHS